MKLIAALIFWIAPWGVNAGVPQATSAPSTQPAAAAPDPPPVLQVAPEQVIAAFLKEVSGNAEFPESARSFVAKAAPTSQPDGQRDFMQSALAVLSQDYASALQALDAEQPAKAAETAAGLAGSDDPFLAVNAANLAATALLEIDEFGRCLELLEHVFATHQPLDRFTLSADHLYFTLGYCQIQMLHYAAAQATLTAFLKEYPNAPQRLRVTATQILTEIERRVPGKLGDVRDLLSYARKRIARGSTDEDVIEKQQEAVALLEAMIKEAEDQEKQSGGGGGGGSRGGRMPQPGSGAQESRLPQGGEGQVELRKTKARPGDAWGKMPPRQRDEIIQTLQKQFPSQYRELLEQYYKQLARDNSPS